MLGVLGGASAVCADGPTISDSAFQTRIAQYMAMRRQAEQRAPGPRVSRDRAEIDSAADALAEAIRQARPHSAPGDIFGARIAADFRQIIQTVLRNNKPRGVNLPDAHPTVNGRFDWNLDAVMPPFLIHALPPLPPELQYRLVGCDLVLVDIVAGLVIDVLPAALTDGC